MRVENEPADVRFLQDWIEAGRVGAVGQPKTRRRGAEKIDIHIAADENLRACGCVRLLLNKRKQSMRCRAADDFERAIVAQLSERAEQIAFPFIDKKTAARRKQ